jgi:lipopolysaccharide transport system ATP-binding protein
MEDVSKGEGRTVLFVSHNMAMVTRLCSHSMLLEKGRLVTMDSTETVISLYLSNGGELEAERTWPDEKRRPGNNKVRLHSVRVTDAEGNLTGTVDIRRPVFIEIRYEVLQPLPHLRVGFRLLSSEGIEVFSSADTGNADWRHRPRGVGHYVSRCKIPGNLLNEGLYMLTVGGDIPNVEGFFVEECAIRFGVEQTGGPGSHDPGNWPGVVCPQLDWEIEPSKRTESVAHFLQK